MTYRTVQITFSDASIDIVVYSFSPLRESVFHFHVGEYFSLWGPSVVYRGDRISDGRGDRSKEIQVIHP